MRPDTAFHVSKVADQRTSTSSVKCSLTGAGTASRLSRIGFNPNARNGSNADVRRRPPPWPRRSGGAICLSRSAMKLPFRGRGEEPSALWNFLDRPVLLHRVVAGPNLDSGTVLELV